MTGTDMQRDEERLEALFAAARANPPAPSEALMARVLADAEVERPRDRRALPAARRALAPRRAGWLGALGGWRGLGGLVTATVAGLWVGYANIPAPATIGDGVVGDLVGGGADPAQVQLLPGAEALALFDGWEG